MDSKDFIVEGLWEVNETDPYKINVTGVYKVDYQVADCSNIRFSDQSIRAHAARIVKCVNAHDELVEHLKNVLWNFEAHKDELTPVQRGCINQIAKTINSLPK